MPRALSLTVLLALTMVACDQSGPHMNTQDFDTQFGSTELWGACDLASEYPLQDPFPIESAADALEVLRLSQPPIWAMITAFYEMDSALADSTGADAAVGIAPDPDCQPIEDGSRLTYRGDCEGRMGGAFTGELIWDLQRNALWVQARDFDYQLDAAHLSLDGRLSHIYDGENVRTTLSMDVDLINDDQLPLSVHQDICDWDDNKRQYRRGYVYAASEGEARYDHDALIESWIGLDDAAPRSTIRVTGTRVILLRQESGTTAGCYEVELDGVDQGEFCP